MHKIRLAITLTNIECLTSNTNISIIITITIISR